MVELPFCRRAGRLVDRSTMFSDGSERNTAQTRKGGPEAARSRRGKGWGRGLDVAESGGEERSIEEGTRLLISILSTVLSNSTRQYQRPPSRNRPTFPSPRPHHAWAGSVGTRGRWPWRWRQ